MQFLQTISDLLISFWPHLLFLFDLAVSIGASAHVVLHKRNTRAAIGWAGIIWLAPILGTILYVLFGVNRIARRAQNLRAGLPQRSAPRGLEVESVDSLRLSLGPQGESLGSLAKLVGEVTQQPLLAGNRFEPLINGDQAYPAMLAAIDEALSTVALTTYIFDNDRSGAQFREALARAVKRGVAVRVIVDDVGRRYSWHSITRSLRKAGITFAKFMPTFVPSNFRYSNLRSHRKILVVDGRIGFTGGMNIRYGHTLAPDCTHPIQDLHFRVEGPVVGQMQKTFAIDWSFCTGEVLTGDAWFPALEAIGPAYARGVDEGPDDNVEQLQLTFLGALASAQRSVMIVTPYFLPDDAILTAISVAALRGIEIDVVVPKQNNLRTVGWAMIPTLRLLLDSGCRVWQSPPPFDHSKIVAVDGIWSFVGSANWDARSLRLNFEFNVEAYDRQLAAQLETLGREKIRASTPLTAADIDGRNLLFKLRDGVARLATPYL